MKAAEKRQVDADRIWAYGEMSTRLAKLRKQWEDAEVIILPDTAVSFTKGYNKEPMLPTTLRFAYAFKQIMEDSKLLIRDGELIVGQMNGEIEVSMLSRQSVLGRF